MKKASLASRNIVFKYNNTLHQLCSSLWTSHRLLLQDKFAHKGLLETLQGFRFPDTLAGRRTLHPTEIFS